MAIFSNFYLVALALALLPTKHKDSVEDRACQERHFSSTRARANLRKISKQLNIHFTGFSRHSFSKHI